MKRAEQQSGVADINLTDINQEMAQRPASLESALYLIRWSQENFDGKVFADTSLGKDSALMWDAIDKSGEDIHFTFGDTQLMPPETYELKDTLTTRYPLSMEVAYPDPDEFEEIVEERLWRSTNRKDLDRFLDVIKLDPLRRLDAKLGKHATIAAARADQTLDREGLDYVVQQHDGTYRIYPFLEWPTRQVNDYIDSYELPRNRLSVLYGLGAVSYRNIVYFENKIEVVNFDSCGRNSPDNKPVH